MDRGLYIGMGGAKQISLAQGVNANNLANANTTGFRAELSAFRSVPVNGPVYASRVHAVNEGVNVDLTPGPLKSTSRELDVAINGEGYIAVQSADGSEAYTRAGDLRLTSLGQLVTGSGDPVLGNGGPIAIPPYEKLEIGNDGTVSVLPVGQDATALAVVDRIKLVKIPNQEVYKGGDGLLRAQDPSLVALDGSVKIASGALEGSNVNTVSAMVNMIDLQRSFEMQVKIMSTIKENGRAADAVLKMS